MPYIPPTGSKGEQLNLIDHINLPLLDGHAIAGRGLGNFHAINASTIYALEQQHTIQVVTTIVACISLVHALCAVYWFFMMRRNFRRDLVLLLILGGAWKSLWFIIFSGVTFTHGPVQTESAFCQISGYLLQLGFSACDFSVLFMSMHMYLQIFPPKHFGLGHDGLYSVRRWVFAAWIGIPVLTASLAFINPNPAFMAQGGFCSIPLRPYWYRLGLFWGPRYLVWCYIVFVAVSIYRYVGREFKVFGQEKDSSSNVPGGSSSKSEHEKLRVKHLVRRISGLENEQEGVGEIESAPDDVSGAFKIRPAKTLPLEFTTAPPPSGARRQSVPNWLERMNAFRNESIVAAPSSKSYPDSRRGSHQVGNGVTAEDFAAPAPNVDPRGHRGSITSIASMRSTAAPSFASTPLPAIREGISGSTEFDQTRSTASKAMQLRRRAIQRQLRLLFIYPCIYMMLWVIPFVVNIMNYTDYWAQHPVFAVGVLQLVCVTIMTSVDVIVFCWRERPWRHIPGSDGTVLGSFMWWRYCFGSTWVNDRRASRAQGFVRDEKETENEPSQSQAGLLGSLKRLSTGRKRSSLHSSEISRMTHKRTFSGGSGRKHLDAERALERLELERKEYEQNRRSLQDKGASVISQQQQASERKEWFDREEDADLFADHDREVEEKPPEA